MANTLTGLTVSLYNALDVVSRELVGFIPAVTLDAQYSRAAVGQTVISPVAPAAAASDVTPGVTSPNDGDQTIGNVQMTISKSRYVPVRWNGEEKRALDNNGASYNVILRDRFAQAIRTLCNEVESDIAALHILASRAYGTAGTTPFATAGDFTDASNVSKILKDNGAPGDLQLVLDTGAGANLIGKQSRYDVAGDTTMQNQGVIIDKAGMKIRESGQVKTHTKGTAAGSTTNAAGYAVGATSITLAAAGTGTIVAGDSITFAGDTNKYMIKTGDTDVSNGGTIVLQEPGLRQAIPAAATAITVVANSTRSMAFSRSAIALATRAPMVPEEGDLAVDSMIITDPRSGLSFEVRLYMQYRQIRYEIALAWGTQLVAPRHAAVLLG